MSDALSSFIIGFLCTGTLFVLCFLVVVGFNAVLNAIKERLVKRENSQSPIPKTKRKRKARPDPNPVRSIEIDPEQIDRIYVKKTS